jgi:hypothetical protein
MDDITHGHMMANHSHMQKKTPIVNHLSNVSCCDLTFGLTTKVRAKQKENGPKTSLGQKMDLNIEGGKRKHY